MVINVDFLLQPSACDTLINWLGPAFHIPNKTGKLFVPNLNSRRECT